MASNYGEMLRCAAERAQAMSDASGESYSITLGMSGLMVVGKLVDKSASRRVCYERLAGNELLHALQIVRNELRYG